MFGAEPYCGIALSTINTKMKDTLIKERNKHWHQSLGCRHSKLIMPTASQKFTEKLLSLNRREISTMLQFLTGHGYFKRHLKTMKMITDNHIECKYCGEEETAEHIMCHCEAYASLRPKLSNIEDWQLKDFSKVEFDDIRKFCKVAFKKMTSPIAS